MKKIKKLVTIALVATMLMGTTLTANAARYVIGVSTTECHYCHRNSAVLREISFSYKGPEYHWQCAVCNNWTET